MRWLLLIFCLTHTSLRADIDASIEKGVHFLIENQNEDGSWGSAKKTKGITIYAPIPGAHHAFRMASTCLALSGLVAHEKECPEASESIENAEAWLFKNHEAVRRATGESLYNVWAHSYGLRAFTDLYLRDRKNQERYLKAAQCHYDSLLKYELLGGGWSYYNVGQELGGLSTKSPSGSNNSFLTATALSAIFYTRAHLPISINEKQLSLSYKSLLRQRLPDGSFLYGEYMRSRPRVPANRPAGSLARTPAAQNALLSHAPNSVKPEELDEWISRFIERHGFLANAKKRPLPHESPFQISGYYYYYGHFYVSEVMRFLPMEKIKIYMPPLVEILIKAQEKNGSWWDFPLYDYHQAYGTGYALQALANYKKEDSEY